MKVLFVTTSFPQISNPNSGFFIKQLIINFLSNIKTTVVTPADKHRSGVIKEKKYTQVNFSYGPPSWRTLAHSPGGLAELTGKKNLKLLLLPVLLLTEFVTVFKWARKTDLIHANWSINGVIAGVVGRLINKPVITTLRGSDVNKAEKSFVFKFLLQLCLRLNSRVVTVNGPLKQKIQKQFSWYKKDISVIENGIEQEFFEIKRDVLEKQDVIRILTIGNLTKNKSVETILEAVSTLSKSSVSVDIVGDGSEREYLEKLAIKLGIDDKIAFHGVVDAADRIPFFQNADILVFASLSEGRPNVILEAMASGLAIVTSNIDGVKELITDENEALFFQPGKVNDLSEKLLRLVEDAALRRKMGELARIRLSQKGLTWNETAEKYEKLYNQTVASKNNQ